MILDLSSRSLQIVLGEAKVTTDCDIVACWAATSASVFAPGMAQTVSNGTTAVTVASGPADGSALQVSEVRLHNNDTISHTVTLQLLDGAQVRIVLRATLAAGADFLYTPAGGGASVPGVLTTAVNTWTAAQRYAVVALTDAATITPDFALGINFAVTLAGNRTLANPSNVAAGQTGQIAVTQDATGSRTLAYGSSWKFHLGTAPTLTTTANALDVLFYYVVDATHIVVTSGLAFS